MGQRTDNRLSSHRSLLSRWQPAPGAVLIACLTVSLMILLFGFGCWEETAPEDPDPELALTPDTLRFGNVTIGAHTDMSFIVRNGGGGRLIGNVAESCTDYSILSGGGQYSLGSGASLTVEVRFAPMSEGPSICLFPFHGGASVVCTGIGVSPPPACSFTPETLDFGSVILDTEFDRTFTITNTGGGTLSGIATADCDAFSVISGGDPFNLGNSQTHQITIRFRPSAPGPSTCTIEMGGAVCSGYTCTGEGVVEPPVCSIDPTTIDFRSVEIGAISEQSFTITNAGGGILSGTMSAPCPDFDIVGGAGAYELPADSGLVVTVRFSPGTEGEKNCAIDLESDLCGGVTCSGFGVLPASCTIEPRTLDFGTLDIGTSRDLTFELMNSGGGVIRGYLAQSCADYDIVSGAGAFVLYAKQSIRATVRFTPSVDGLQTCTIDTGSDSCGVVTCIGTGIGAVCSISPAELEFGSVEIGSSLDRAFSIDNIGASILTGAVTETCPDFSILSGGGSYRLRPDDPPHVVTIRFSPESEGTQNCAILTGGLCAAVNCVAVGVGMLPCSVFPASLNFGQVTVGETAERTFQVTNLGQEALRGTVVESCPDYEIISGGGEYSLAPGGSREVTLSFAPASAGESFCLIETGDLCFDVECTGFGLSEEPVCTVEPSQLDFGDVVAGSVSDLSFSITNDGDGTLSGLVAESCGMFTILAGEGSYDLTTGQMHDVVVRFEPDSIGTFECTIDTGAELCGGVPCTGTGTDEPPLCSIEPAGLDFGEVEVGQQADSSFTITNLGGGIVSGTVSESCDEFALLSGAGAYNLGNGDTLAVVVRLSPTSPGAKNCVVETGTTQCDDVQCSGEATSDPPICEISADSLAFGEVLVGVDADLDFTISNTGGGTLAGAVFERCADYSIVSGGGAYELSGGESVDVTVRFSPSAEGSSPCIIETDNALCPSIPCTGFGKGPICDLSYARLDFGEVLVGDSNDRTFVISNLGGGLLDGSVSDTCDYFIVTAGQGPYSLGAGENHVVTIRFSPGTGGPDTCTVGTGNDLCGDVVCTGSGIASSCLVTPTRINFDPVLLGTTAELSFAITNVGGGFLVGEASESCPHFSIVAGSGPYSLGANETRVVTIEFAPESLGEHQCTVDTGDESCADVVCAGQGIGPICSIDPPALTFGAVPIGAAVDSSFTITNTGAGLLSGTVSENCADYSIISGAGPYALGADGELTVTVRFEPLSEGALPCIIETGNGLCSDVGCTGEGVGPICDVDPADLDFEQVIVGSFSDLTFRITNTGGGTLDGAVSETCDQYLITGGGGSYSLAAEEFREVTVRYAPIEFGIHNCVVETGDTTCVDVSCTGEGVGPICAISPASFDFGSVNVGASVDSVFTITNEGVGTLTGSVSESCADYSIPVGAGAYALGAGEEHSVTVRFEPQSAGTLPCTIETGTEYCSDFGCVGVGVGASCEIAPTTLEFGQVEIDSSLSATFTIRNTGGGWLTGSVSESCPHYSIPSGGGAYNVAAGDSIEVTVQYSPTELGTHNCTVETGDDLCVDVGCTGEGVGPICSVTPATLDFGSVNVGATVDSTFTITNTGVGTLTGTVSEACADYSITQGEGAYALGEGEMLTVTVRFEPQSAGALPCTIETGTDLCSDVDCTGEGLGPVCDVSESSLDFGQVTVGSTADLDFRITNTGGGWLTGSVSDTCSHYSVITGGGSYNLGAGEFRDVTVQFAPASSGIHTCTIETGDALCIDVECTGEGCPDCPPSPLTVDATSSVTITSEHPDSNFCGQSVGWAGHSADGTEDFEMLFYFDVSGIPEEATITAVELQVFADSCTYSAPDDTVLVSLSRLDAAFTECSVTWTGAPAATPISGCADTLLCSPAGYNTIDCVGLVAVVQQWIDNAADNFGIEIVPAAAEAGAIVIRSRHHAAATPPRLVVTFTCPCQ